MVVESRRGGSLSRPAVARLDRKCSAVRLRPKRPLSEARDSGWVGVGETSALSSLCVVLPVVPDNDKDVVTTCYLLTTTFLLFYLYC